MWIGYRHQISPQLSHDDACQYNVKLMTGGFLYPCKTLILSVAISCRHDKGNCATFIMAFAIGLALALFWKHMEKGPSTSYTNLRTRWKCVLKFRLYWCKCRIIRICYQDIYDERQHKYVRRLLAVQANNYRLRQHVTTVSPLCLFDRSCSSIW